MSKHRRIRPSRLAAGIAGVTVASAAATAALSGTAFADDVRPVSIHETHLSHAAHAAHQAHVIHTAGTESGFGEDSRLSASSIDGTDSADKSSAGFVSPVPDGTRISQSFGVPSSGYAAGYHTGVDFAVSTGTTLHAIDDSTVVSAGWAGDYGNAVVLKLAADHHYALYAHMSHLSVSAGQKLSAGDKIGRSGSTGNATGPHLHLEIRTKNVYGAVIDPVSYLQRKGVFL